MSRAPVSGYAVTKSNLPLILAMIDRGDRKHDIAAWFGLNQGRIKQAKDGYYGTPSLAARSKLPPAGSPGPKARGLRAAVSDVRKLLSDGGAESVSAAIKRLDQAAKEFDKNE